MSRSDVLVTIFVSTVEHEALLRAIRRYTYMLYEGYETDDPQQDEVDYEALVDLQHRLSGEEP